MQDDRLRMLLAAIVLIGLLVGLALLMNNVLTPEEQMTCRKNPDQTTWTCIKAGTQ